MSEQLGYVPIDRDDLLARIARGWDELEAAVASVPLEQLGDGPAGGGWTAKDHLAHVTTWLQVVLARIERAPEHAIFGMDPATYRASDEEALNEVAHRLHRDRPAAEVLADLRATHARVVEAVSRLSAAELRRPTWSDAPHRGPLIENIHGNTAEHYQHHAGDIRAIRGGL